MAYDKKKILKDALELIDKHALIFVEDIVSLLPISMSIFYQWFPAKSEEMETIKKALEKNRVSMKSNMRKKWYKSDNATLQVALMKLIANEDEAARLSGNTREKETTHKLKLVWGESEESKDANDNR